MIHQSKIFFVDQENLDKHVKKIVCQGGGLVRPTLLFYYFLQDSRENEIYKASVVPALHMAFFVITLAFIQVRIVIEKIK